MRFQDLEVRSPNLGLPEYGPNQLEASRAEIRDLYGFLNFCLYNC